MKGSPLAKEGKRAHIWQEDGDADVSTMCLTEEM